MMNKISDPLSVFSQIRDNCVIAISGFNLATTPEYLILELYRRYNELGHPKNIFIISDALPATPHRALDLIAESIYKDENQGFLRGMRINEFLPILHTIVANGDIETAKITTAKILTYSLVLLNETNSKGISLPGAQELFKQAENLWIQGKYEQVLPLAAKLAKMILPVVHPEWQTKPSFSIYRLNAKIADGGQELSLSGLPLTVRFQNIKQEKFVTTNSRGETVFIGPSNNFSIDGIGTGNSINGGMTNMNVVMDGNSGKWLMHTSTS